MSRVCAFLILALISLSTAGCVGSVELNEIHIVHSLAIDKGNKHNIKLTAEISKITPSGQQPKGMQNDKFYLSQEGESLFEAARQMRNKSDRMLLWGHASSILFSKAIAEQGIMPQIEAIRRLRQFRNTALLFITEGNAFEILQLSSPSATINSQVFQGLVEGGKSTGQTSKTTLLMAYRDYTNEFKDIAIPLIYPTIQAADEDKSILKASGMYAFHGDRLSGKLSPSLTKAYLRASNLMEGTIESITCDDGGHVTLENIMSKAKTNVNINASLESRVSITINADLTITNLTCKGMDITPDTIHVWEGQLNTIIEQDIRKFFQYTQKQKVDLLGIGERIHRSNPKQWKAMKSDWMENRYGLADFEVQVHTRIDHSNFLM